MNLMTAGLATAALVATCLDCVSARAAAEKADPRFVWPKNSQCSCRGVLIQEQGTYRLKPDQTMLTWCDADFEENDISRVLTTCKLADRCEIKGTIEGHGPFGWTEIRSIKAIKTQTK